VQIWTYNVFVYSRLLSPINQGSLFLFGPRGTGKTTWVKTKFPTALYFDLLKAETYNFFLANPSRLEESIPEKFSDWVIIDEIKAPSALNSRHSVPCTQHNSRAKRAIMF